MHAMLERERAACYLRNTEGGVSIPETLAFDGFIKPISPQNEAAALSACLKHGGALDQRARAELDALCNSYCERTGAQGHSPESEAGPSGRPYPDGSQEGRLRSWCVGQGLQARVSPATFGSGLRGVQADADISAGDVVISMPASCLISYRTAMESDLGRALQCIPGLSEEALAVVWTMIDCVDGESPYAPYWRSLPACFGTALGVPEEVLEACLKGTALLEEARQARKHIKGQYEALAPVLETLARAYPQFVPRDCIAWESYLWAVECWYAYAIQVQMHPSKQDTCPCLAPFIGLVNHSPWPHAVHFSAVDKTRRLNVRCFRPCKAGQQFFISYGPLANAKLLLFYGFCVANNPYDHACISLEDLAAEADVEVKKLLTDLHLGAEQRVSCKDRVPARLLAAARAAVLTPEQFQEVQHHHQQHQQRQQQQNSKDASSRNRKTKGQKEAQERPQSLAGFAAQACPGWLLTPLTEDRESAALQLLQRAIRKRLDALPGHGANFDSAACSGSVGAFAASAALYVEGQKQALHSALDEIQGRLGKFVAAP